MTKDNLDRLKKNPKPHNQKNIARQEKQLANLEEERDELFEERKSAQNSGQSVGDELKKEFLRNLANLSEMLNTRI